MRNYQTVELGVKNMICSRCLKVMRQAMESMGAEILELKLGRLKIRFPANELSIEAIESRLEQDDFEIIKNPDNLISEQIKLALIELINNLPVPREHKLSEYLARKLHRDYWTLSKLFSKTEGATIEKYFIQLRIEKAKELIEYGEINFSEIAFELGYKNIFHLSNQFKKRAGMSMTDYKKAPDKLRKPFDKIL